MKTKATPIMKTNIKLLRILYPIWMIIGIASIVIIPESLAKSEPIRYLSEHLLIFRLGILGRLITQLLFIIIPFLLFRLFEKVNQPQALLMIAFAYLSIPLTIYNETHQLILPEVWNQPAIFYQHLLLYQQGQTLTELFWGLWLFPLGRLTQLSEQFPNWITGALWLGGCGYLIGGISNLLFPGLPYIYSISEVLSMGELIFILWIMIKGLKPITPSFEADFSNDLKTPA
ncbi:DUF4386 domain-containing protein [Persicobacter diffluens]|uniref:DUF4386 domain-containing protein n=1 Tax=Persicobacter diffluens TaxID=981 RepID=A0AAN5ALI0_9BACT|nr:DUF4386 domain-containing protein [Persicobacter diffluens]